MCKTRVSFLVASSTILAVLTPLQSSSERTVWCPVVRDSEDAEFDLNLGNNDMCPGVPKLTEGSACRWFDRGKPLNYTR